MRKDKKKTVVNIIEDLQGDICDNFCKYRDSTDEDCVCEWIRQGNACPLDVLW